MLKIEVSLPPMVSITKGIEKAMLDAVNLTADAVEKDFQSSVKDFVHKPSFTKERAAVKGDAVEAVVYTNDENYTRLNYGTSAHPVGAGGKWMSFHPAYHPKTALGHIFSTPGGFIGGRRVRAKGPWRVSGIEPRRWDRLIVAKNQPVLEAALARFLKAR